MGLFYVSSASCSMSVLHDLLFFISAAVDALLMFVQSRAECFRKRPRESNAYLSPLPPFMGKTAPTLEFRDHSIASSKLWGRGCPQILVCDCLNSYGFKLGHEIRGRRSWRNARKPKTDLHAMFAKISLSLPFAWCRLTKQAGNNYSPGKRKTGKILPPLRFKPVRLFARYKSFIPFPFVKRLC